MDEDDLKDYWRDYLTKPKQIFQCVTCEGLDDDDDDDYNNDDKISHASVYMRLYCYITKQLPLRNVNVRVFGYL
jgi:hypothetical protein